MDPEAVLKLVTEYMPNLEHLDLDIRWRGNVKELLEKLPESICTLKLRGVHHTAPPLSVEASETWTVRRHHALETFDISGTLSGPETAVLDQFLSSCGPRLKTISGMGFSWCIRNEAILRTLSSIGFVWTELNRALVSRHETDRDVASLIAQSSWSVIDIYTNCAGPMTVNAIVENCDNLTVLNIMEPGNTAMTGAHLQTILSKAKHLTSLQVHWLSDAQKYQCDRHPHVRVGNHDFGTHRLQDSRPSSLYRRGN